MSSDELWLIEQQRKLLKALDVGGGRAFPLFIAPPSTDDAIPATITPGMSMREFYAGLAMVGLIARSDGGHEATIASEAFRHADAMLEYDSKKKEGGL